MATLPKKLFRSHTQGSPSAGTSTWKSRLLKYVGLFLLLGTPLTFAAWQGAASDQQSKVPRGNVSVKQPGTEVQLMKPDQSQSQSKSGNSASSHVRVETNVRSSTSTRPSSDQQSSSGSSATNQNTSSTSVTINGQDVPLPSSGELHRTFRSPDGSRSSVDISVHGNGDSTDSSSSVKVHVDGSANQ